MQSSSSSVWRASSYRIISQRSHSHDRPPSRCRCVARSMSGVRSACAIWRAPLARSRSASAMRSSSTASSPRSRISSASPSSRTLRFMSSWPWRYAQRRRIFARTTRSGSDSASASSQSLVASTCRPWKYQTSARRLIASARAAPGTPRSSARARIASAYPASARSMNAPSAAMLARAMPRSGSGVSRLARSYSEIASSEAPRSRARCPDCSRAAAASSFGPLRRLAEMVRSRVLRARRLGQLEM